MTHETTLVATIAVSLAVAYLFGFAAPRLGLRPLVGYPVAGARFALRCLGLASGKAEASVQAMRPTAPATATDPMAVLQTGGSGRAVAAGRPQFGEGS